MAAACTDEVASLSGDLDDFSISEIGQHFLQARDLLSDSQPKCPHVKNAQLKHLLLLLSSSLGAARNPGRCVFAAPRLFYEWCSGPLRKAVCASSAC